MYCVAAYIRSLTSTHCHVDAEHDCGFLASLANRTEVALKKKKKKGDFNTGKKMARADKEEETITVERRVKVILHLIFVTGVPR